MKSPSNNYLFRPLTFLVLGYSVRYMISISISAEDIKLSSFNLIVSFPLFFLFSTSLTVINNWIFSLTEYVELRNCSNTAKCRIPFFPLHFNFPQQFSTSFQITHMEKKQKFLNTPLANHMEGTATVSIYMLWASYISSKELHLRTKEEFFKKFFVSN